MFKEGSVVKVNIEDQMKSSYIDYSMSVIVSRALPDIRDGLKPVHRRVLFGMLELGMLPARPYKKSARIVGDVLGKYHPHGDSSVYYALVRMAQDWSLRYPLVDGQGNFGSVDGDSPAAMRYTEVRMKKITEELMHDIDKETVDFQFNFDDTLKEPTVLPTRLPNLLINGSSGIAVGMATNMAPHNLKEVVDACVAYINDNEISIEGLMQHIKAPDFPTGGILLIDKSLKEAYETGKGRVVLRGRAEIENISNGREQIIVTEIPYLVVKSELIKRIAELVNDKKIEGISDIRDESDRNGMRIVFEIKKGTNSNVLLNNLFKFTPLQNSFSINNVALVKGRPKTLNLKELISNFIEHRNLVIIKRSEFDLKQAEKKLHILEGLLIALDHIDEIIELIKKSATPNDAKDGLMKNFSLSEEQSKAILELRLQRLTGLERDKIKQEHKEIVESIKKLKSILESFEVRMNIVKEELLEIKEKYGDERRSEISFDPDEINMEDIIPNDEMIITISHEGYIKRLSLDKVRTQNRGGIGSRAAETKDSDWIENMFVARNHEYLILLTELGKCFWLKVYEIPEGSKISKGRPIQNIISLAENDKISAWLNVKDLKNEEYIKNNHILMCTKKGVIKKSSLEHYSRPRTSGIVAINLDEGDRVIGATLTDGKKHIIIGAKSGKAIHFHEENVREIGRTSRGVRGITLKDTSDEVIGFIALDKNDKLKTVLVVTEKGYAKRSNSDEYRITNRGGKGVKALNVTLKTGKLIAIKHVLPDDEIVLINKSGTMIRVSLINFKVLGRVTQGVRLINLKNNDEIASVESVVKMEENINNENEEKDDINQKML